MKLLRSLAVAAVLLLASVAAFADPTVSVSGSLATTVAQTLPLAQVGQTLFATQEAVHATVTAATGVSVPHYYLHVVVGGADVPVDPLRVSR